MLRWAIAFAIIALIAGVLRLLRPGRARRPTSPSSCVLVFVVLFVVALIVAAGVSSADQRSSDGRSPTGARNRRRSTRGTGPLSLEKGDPSRVGSPDRLCIRPALEPHPRPRCIPARCRTEILGFMSAASARRERLMSRRRTGANAAWRDSCDVERAWTDRCPT